MWWHTRRNQILSFHETDESIYIGGGVSSVDYWKASCTHQPAKFVLLVQACVLQSCDAYWLPTPSSCFPFTSPPVRHSVPSHFNWTLRPHYPMIMHAILQVFLPKKQHLSELFPNVLRTILWPYAYLAKLVYLATYIDSRIAERVFMIFNSGKFYKYLSSSINFVKIVLK
jgi:hypothetical protein